MPSGNKRFYPVRLGIQFDKVWRLASEPSTFALNTLTAKALGVKVRHSQLPAEIDHTGAPHLPTPGFECIDRSIFPVRRSA